MSNKPTNQQTDIPAPFSPCLSDRKPYLCVGVYQSKSVSREQTSASVRTNQQSTNLQVVTSKQIQNQERWWWAAHTKSNPSRLTAKGCICEAQQVWHSRWEDWSRWLGHWSSQSALKNRTRNWYGHQVLLLKLSTGTRTSHLFSSGWWSNRVLPYSVYMTIMSKQGDKYGWHTDVIFWVPYCKMRRILQGEYDRGSKSFSVITASILHVLLKHRGMSQKCVCCGVAAVCLFDVHALQTCVT